MLAGRVSSPVLRLAQMWQDFQQVRISMYRLGDILNTHAEPAYRPNRNTLPAIKGRLTFEHATFRYRPDGPEVLADVTLDIAPGQVIGPIKDAIKYLKDAGDIAAEYKLKLAIEFNSQHDVLNSLAVLTELIEGAAKPNCGYLIDAYHFTRSGAGGRGFESVPADKIYCFQYSDLSPNPVTGVRRPTDRLPPGKGVVKWREMLGLLAEKGYTGYLSYEAPNPDQWARSPYEVAREGVELTRKLLRDAVPNYVS